MVLFAFSWFVVIGISYAVTHHEIEEVFDAQLAQSSGILSRLLVRHFEEGTVLPGELDREVFGHKYEQHISFQIWDGDQLVMHSQSAPKKRLSNRLGFTDEMIEGEKWRVFGMKQGENSHVYYAAEKYHIRNELIRNITITNILPLLWVLPLLAVSIWFSVKRGLAPLNVLAKQVENRSPASFATIDERGVPREVAPLVKSLNGLLVRLETAFGKERAFSANAAHELRTPLSIIKLHAQVALRSAVPGERTEALEKIIQGVDRNSHLVEQLLALGRLSDQTAAEDFQDVSLLELAKNVIAEMAPHAMEKGVTLSFVDRCSSVLGCRVRGNFRTLAVLLRNLIDNAIRYGPSDSEVTVSVSRDGNTVRMCVTDKGPGIPVNFRELAFDGFYRGPERKTEGSGLGLSIVKRIAQLHQAEIYMEDAPSGTGLQVTLSFQAAEDDGETEAGQRRRPAKRRKSGLRGRVGV